MEMVDRMIVRRAPVVDAVAVCDVGNRLPARAARKRPLDPLRHVNVLVRLGRHEEAASAAREVLRADPQNLAALEILAKMLWQTSDLEGVVDATRRLVALNPYEPGYHVLQASALQCLGRYGEAARAYQRAGNVPGIQDAIDDLNSWQAELVAEMVATDPVFRAHYAQNPAEACFSRGFSFLEGSSGRDHWLPGAENRASLFTRPS